MTPADYAAQRAEHDKQQQEVFLAGLTELTQKTGVKIHGCGCCGSPYLVGGVDRDVPGKYEVTEGFDNVEWVIAK